MRIFVMGAGAVGGYFGARLAAAGEDVVLGVRAGDHVDFWLARRPVALYTIHVAVARVPMSVL